MQFIDLKKQYQVLKADMDAAIANAVEGAHYIGGPEVKELATRLAEYCGVKYCLTCANGTDALTLAMRCLGVTKGDAVFVPTFTFFSTAEAVALEGATCVFVDVDERTFNMDPQKLEQAIAAVKREGKLNLKCIIAVDLFGQVANFPKIREIADKYGMKVVEDGAQGFGGSIDGKKACSFGDISTTSFFPAKPLGCYGDGGAVFTDNEEYFKLMGSLAVHGKGDYKYDNVRIGYNSRLDTVQAAVLSVKLTAFEKYELADRNKVAARYTAALSDIFKTPVVPQGYESSWAQYTLITDSESERDRLQAALKEKGIPTMVYYPIPMHLQTAFKGCKADYCDLSVAEKLCKSVLSIPMHPYLDQASQDAVIAALRECASDN